MIEKEKLTTVEYAIDVIGNATLLVEFIYDTRKPNRLGLRTVLIDKDSLEHTHITRVDVPSKDLRLMLTDSSKNP